MTYPYETPNYHEEEDARWVVGGDLDIISGGELDIEAGATLEIHGVDVHEQLGTLAVAPNNTLWVDCQRTDAYTEDGTFYRPYKTLEDAVTNVVAGQTILVMPGEYNPVASMSIAVQGVHIRGLGNVTVIGAAAEDEIFICDPADPGADFNVTFEDLDLTMAAAKVGLQFNNTNLTGGMYIILKNVTINSAAGGNSIDINHATAGQLISLAADDCYFDTAVDMVIKNVGDTIKMRNCTLVAALNTSADALAALMYLKNCQVLQGGAVTGGNAAQVLYIAHSWSLTGAGVLANVVAGDVTGAQTETIV